MLARRASAELGQHGIRVVNVAPGAVDIPLNASTKSDPDKLKTFKDAISGVRLAEPDGIAEMRVTPASGTAWYVTPTTLFIDGGIMPVSVGL